MGDAGRWIVVGVDGSEPSHRAVDRALEEASLRGIGCRLVHVWSAGALPGDPYVAPMVNQIERSAQRCLDREMARVAGRGVPIEEKLVFGSAPRVLVEVSAEAELLVVGTRGRGGVAGALLGSVSTACVHHARCPVMVVPAPEAGTGG